MEMCSVVANERAIASGAIEGRGFLSAHRDVSWALLVGELAPRRIRIADLKG